MPHRPHNVIASIVLVPSSPGECFVVPLLAALTAGWLFLPQFLGSAGLQTGGLYVDDDRAGFWPSQDTQDLEGTHGSGRILSGSPSSICLVPVFGSDASVAGDPYPLFFHLCVLIIFIPP